MLCQQPTYFVEGEHLSTESDDLPLPPSAFLASLPIEVNHRSHITSLPNMLPTDLHKYEKNISYDVSKKYNLKLPDSERDSKSVHSELEMIRQENASLRLSVSQATRHLEAMKAYIGHTPYSVTGNTCKLANPASLSDQSKWLDASSAEQSLDDKVTELRQVNENLERQLKLSNIRVQSLETVLQLQEKRLNSLENGENGKNSSQGKAALPAQLLTYWRTQVLRLLISEEQAKAERVAEASRHQRQVDQLRCTVKQADDNTESEKLKLRATEAALATERSRIDVLKTKLQDSTKRESNAVNREQHQRQRFCQLLSTMQTSVTRLSESVLQFMSNSVTQRPAAFPGVGMFPVAVRRLGQLERRMNFAINRLPPLRAKLAVACIRPTSEEAVQTISFSTSADLEELLHYAQLEVEKTRGERDELLQKYEEYVKTYNLRVQTVQNDVKAEVTNLRESVRALEGQLAETKQALNHRHDQLEALKAEQIQSEAETNSERISLQNQLKDTQEQLSRSTAAVRHAERQIQLELNERKQQMAELEDKYQARIRSLERALRMYYPETYKWYPNKELNLSNRGEDATVSSKVKSRSHISPSQLDSMTKSLGELAGLVMHMNDSESDEPVDLATQESLLT